MDRPAWLIAAHRCAATRPLATTLLAACLLMLPNLLFGVVQIDNVQLNYLWAQQFVEQLREGIAYPRWLPRSFEGLGSPTFFFYAPLPFYLCAAVDLPTFGWLSTERVIGIAATLLMFASGIAMRAWLATQVGPAMATFGGIAYMAAPYHLFDHYARGAFGEFAAYASLPVIALGMLRLARGQRGMVRLAIGYAALILSHLPSALLASVTLIPLMLGWHALRLAREDGAALAAGYLARCALGGGIGLALAAPYLLPALTLQDMIASERFWVPYFRAEHSLLLAPWDWSNPTMMRLVAGLALGAAILAAAVLVAAARARRPGDRGVVEAMGWAAFALFCLLLLAGAVPAVWTVVPMLGKVQFPWRLLTVVDFAVVTALCRALAAGCRMPRWAGAAALAATPTMVVTAMLVVSATLLDSDARRATYAAAQARMWDSAEYLPPGHRLPLPDGPRAISTSADFEAALAPLRDRPMAIAEPAGAAAVAVTPGQHGAMHLHIQASAPAAVALRRFHTPLWELRDLRTGATIPTVPWGPDRLLSFTVPAGDARLALARRTLPAERLGLQLAAIGLLGLGLLALLERRRPA